jgi:hypothetical protein
MYPERNLLYHTRPVKRMSWFEPDDFFCGLVFDVSFVVAVEVDEGVFVGL